MTSGRWIISHRCSWIVVYVLCCNAQVNLIVILMIFVCFLYSINCPVVICVPSMLFILWRDTSSELWTPVHSFTLLTTIFYHTIRLILCLQQTGEIDNLTVSWGKVLGCVVCRFHIAAGAKLCPRQGTIYKLSGAVAKPASINLWKLVLSPTGLINLGFILREDLLLWSSYLPLGVPNWAVIYTPSLQRESSCALHHIPQIDGHFPAS
jgi:hypothetical protein